MCIYIFAFSPTLQINKYVVGAIHRLLNPSPPPLGPYRKCGPPVMEPDKVKKCGDVTAIVSARSQSLTAKVGLSSLPIRRFL